MASKAALETKPTQTEKVDAYMREFDHPLKEVVEALRKIILSTSHDIGEEIKWNAPAFFYSGPMAPSDPKEYKRYLIVFNLAREDNVLLVWRHGARVDDGSGFLQGDYADGRRLIRFYSKADVTSKKRELQKVIKLWLSSVNEKKRK